MRLTNKSRPYKEIDQSQNAYYMISYASGSSFKGQKLYTKQRLVVSNRWELLDGLSNWLGTNWSFQQLFCGPAYDVKNIPILLPRTSKSYGQLKCFNLIINCGWKRYSTTKRLFFIKWVCYFYLHGYWEST